MAKLPAGEPARQGAIKGPMAEPPSYRRQEGIKPGEVGASFQGAMEGASRSYEVISNLGSNIAQSVSNQIAQQWGVEAAQNPGQMLFPAINESTAQFNQSYVQEENDVLGFHANQYLNKIYNDLNQDPNPTQETLLSYQKQAQEGVDYILQYANDKYRPDLKRRLQNAVDNNFLTLSNKVFNSNRKYMIQQNAAQLEQHVENSENAYRNDNSYMASEEYEKAFDALNKKAELENWPRERILMERDALHVRLESGKQNAEVLKKPIQEREKYISELRTKLPESFTPLQKDQIVQNVDHFNNQYEAAFKGQRQINYLNALAKLNTEGLTATEISTLDIDAHQAAQLNLAQAKINKKQNDLNILKNNMKLDNALEMSQYSNKQVDAVYQDRLKQDVMTSGQGMTLRRMAELASDINHEIPSLRDAIETNFRSGTLEQKKEAAQAFKYLAQVNPEPLHGFDNKVGNAIDKFQAGIKGGMPEEILLKNADENLRPLSDEEAAKRAEDLTKVKNKQKWNNPEKFKKDVAGLIDIKSGLIGDGVMYTFSENFNQYYQDTGDAERAKEYAAQALQRTHGITNMNGFEQYVFAPIEKFYDLGNGISWVRAEFYTDAKELIAKQKEAYDKGAQSWYYEIEHNPNLEAQLKEHERLGLPLTKTIHDRPIKIKKMTKSNNRAQVIGEGILGINSDNATGMPVDGAKPSYGIYMITDGRYEAINLPGSRAGARFTPDYQKQLNIKRQKRTEEMEFRKSVIEQQKIGMEELVPSPIGGGLIHPGTRLK